MPPAPQRSRLSRRPRRWSTRPGGARNSYPGVVRHRRRFKARVCLGGRWLYLGSFETEWEAERAARRARELKRQGRLPRKAA